MTGPAAGAMNTADVAGLVRSELTAAGIRRQRCGQGFRYFAADGTPLTDRETLARIKALVIPPAWEDVLRQGLPDLARDRTGRLRPGRLRARGRVRVRPQARRRPRGE